MELMLPPLIQSPSPSCTPKTTYCKSDSSTITDCPSPDLVSQHYSISSVYDLDMCCSMASPYELSRLDQNDSHAEWSREWNPAIVLHPSLASSRAPLSHGSNADYNPFPANDAAYWPTSSASPTSKTATGYPPMGSGSTSSSSRLPPAQITNHGCPRPTEASQYPSPSIAHAYPPTMNNSHALSSQPMCHLAESAPAASPAPGWHETDNRYITESSDPSQQHQEAGSNHAAGLQSMTQHDTQSASGSTRARQKASRRLTTKEDANFECAVEGCGKLFSRSYNYKAHMETHREKRDYPFPCQVQDCSRRFVRKTDLRRHHHSVHVKERNYKCEFCGRGFSRRDTLGRHETDGCHKRFDIGTMSLRGSGHGRDHSRSPNFFPPGGPPQLPPLARPPLEPRMSEGLGD